MDHLSLHYLKDTNLYSPFAISSLVTRYAACGDLHRKEDQAPASRFIIQMKGENHSKQPKDGRVKINIASDFMIAMLLGKTSPKITMTTVIIITAQSTPLWLKKNRQEVATALAAIL